MTAHADRRTQSSIRGRGKLRSPGSISTLIVAPPIESDLDGTGVSDGFADAALRAAAALSKHTAASIAAAILDPGIRARRGKAIFTKQAVAADYCLATLSTVISSPGITRKIPNSDGNPRLIR